MSVSLINNIQEITHCGKCGHFESMPFCISGYCKSKNIDVGIRTKACATPILRITKWTTREILEQNKIKY